jgi:hypothetical protein
MREHLWFGRFCLVIGALTFVGLVILFNHLQLPVHATGQAWLLLRSPQQLPPTQLLNLLNQHQVRMLDAGIDDVLWRIDIPSSNSRHALQMLVDQQSIVLIQPINPQGWVVGCWGMQID